jgi:NAD(P)-dependent dehydrogenase (short-subunit alcohol dehydrogenase family)
MRGLKGKTVVVTGGSLGIGAATCRRLAEEGCNVALADVREAEGRRTAEDLSADPGKVEFYRLDVTDEDEIVHVLQEVSGRFGRIDAVVNNAGISGVDKPPHEIGRDEWQKVMDVNVTGVFLVTKHAISHLRSAGSGSIVNLSSIYGIISSMDIPPYHASKGAVREMSKTDALFYADDGIRVNSVHPGFVWTPLVEDLAKRSGDPEGFRAELDACHPIGRVGRPEEIAGGIAFLVSDDASFMTGSELVIDGGYIAR